MLDAEDFIWKVIMTGDAWFKVLTSVRIWGDLQIGLQGVDNGAIRFNNVRIPRANLLDRFGQVDRAGTYTSPYTMNRRFAATLGELTGGRVGLTYGSLGILKVSSKQGVPIAAASWLLDPCLAS